MTTSKPRLAFLLTTDAQAGLLAGDPGYLRITARLIHLEDGRPRSFLGSDPGPAAGLADLTVSAQATPGLSDRSFGWKVEYTDAGYVDLDRIQAMGRVLGRVTRRLAAMDAELGYAESFAAYLLRVAKVLGVRAFCVWARRPAHFQDEGDLRTWPAPVAADWLREQERAYLAEHTPAA